MLGRRESRFVPYGPNGRQTNQHGMIRVQPVKLYHPNLCCDQDLRILGVSDFQNFSVFYHIVYLPCDKTLPKRVGACGYYGWK